MSHSEETTPSRSSPEGATLTPFPAPFCLVEAPLRALRACEAGVYLAGLLGLDEPFSAQQMWAMARSNAVPVVRIGRLIFWQTTALEAFVASGGRWGANA